MIWFLRRHSCGNVFHCENKRHLWFLFKTRQLLHCRLNHNGTNSLDNSQKEIYCLTPKTESISITVSQRISIYIRTWGFSMRMSPLETIINFNIFKIMRGERGECKGAIHVQQLITTVSSYLHFATDNQYPKFN